MEAYDDLATPAALVDLDVLEANLATMAERARRAGVRLRPHTKTHKTTAIARAQLAHGAAGLTVATLREAEVMAAAGVTDLLLAYPPVGAATLDRLRRLSELVTLTVALDDAVTAEGVGAVGRALGRPLPVLVEVDSGHHRCGRTAGVEAAEVALAVASVDGVEVIGLMTHAGHAYAAADDSELRQIAHDEAAALVVTAEALARRGMFVRELSVGSTPTARFLDEVVAEQPSITEARPGTYVFNDTNQVLLGTAGWADCALRVLATVVSRPATDRVIVDAGSKTLGSDRDRDGTHGRVRGSDGVVERLSEEHGWLRVPRDAPWRIGDRVEVIPSHACLVPNLVDELLGVRAGAIAARIPVEARGHGPEGGHGPAA